MFKHPGHLVSLALLSLATLATACGSNPPPAGPGYDTLVAPSTVEPADDIEREALVRLASVTAPANETVQGTAVAYGAPYDAASGHSCLKLRIGDDAERLACLIDGAWSFVPDVTPAETAP